MASYYMQVMVRLWRQLTDTPQQVWVHPRPAGPVVVGDIYTQWHTPRSRLVGVFDKRIPFRDFLREVEFTRNMHRNLNR